ncbi:hypothetical protein EB796_013606 [Bugula neritina]|uniref:Uncharacterized protein n=1 Tax=Bugula neritina TaxID=10212 RepID=A0A7J7JQ62_BUGNE|nr:hypothetical protein EB796_013606 [Bugula neritina]
MTLQFNDILNILLNNIFVLLPFSHSLWVTFYAVSVAQSKLPLLISTAGGDMPGHDIPQCVKDRGRRMSRSASCMSELIRQELSDYVDNKSEHLPSLVSSSSQIIDKQKLSFNTEVNLTQMSGGDGEAERQRDINRFFSPHPKCLRQHSTNRKEHISV